MRHTEDIAGQSGFRPTRLVSYDDASLLLEIKRVIDTFFSGRPPTKEDFDKRAQVRSWLLRKRFGTWANAVQKAGYEWHGRTYDELDLRRPRYTKELMVADLLKIKDSLGGQYFSQKGYKSAGGQYSVKTLKKHFECSWEDLLQSWFSLSPPSDSGSITKIYRRRRVCSADYTDEYLMAELSRVWEEFGRRPSYAEFITKSCIGIKHYERKFGSWTKAIEAYVLSQGSGVAGLAGSNATKEILLAELKAVYKQSNQSILIYKKYRSSGGVYSISAFQHHFGSWKNAVNEIGLSDGHSGKYTKEELFYEMQRLWEKLGRQPTFRDMNTYGSISGKAFQNRFGSWMRAVHAFCEDRQSEREEAAPFEAIPGDDAEQVPLPTAVEDSDWSLREPIAAPQAVVLVDARRNPGHHLRFRVFQRDGFKCKYCGQSPELHSVTLHVDHIIPWSRGGMTEENNLVTACAECNRGKSDILL